MLLAAAGLLAGCGEPPPGHETTEHYANFAFDHNPDTRTYGRKIGVSFDERCRITLHGDSDGDGHLDRTWVVSCTDEERIAGQQMLSDARIAIYEQEAGSIDDPDRRCSLSLSLAPYGESRLFFYSETVDYGPEVEEMFAFFEGLFATYDILE